MSDHSTYDNELVARVVASQDAKAFGELVRRHQSQIRNFLRKLTRDTGHGFIRHHEWSSHDGCLFPVIKPVHYWYSTHARSPKDLGSILRKGKKIYPE